MGGDDRSGFATSLLIDGERLELTKDPSAFTVRLRQEASPSALDRRYGLRHEGTLIGPALELFRAEDPELDPAMEAVRGSEAVTFASHVYHDVGDPAPIYLTDEIVVEVAPGTDRGDVERFTAGLGLEWIESFAILERTDAYRVTGLASENPVKIAQRLLAEPWVESAEPDVAVRTRSRYVPSNALFGRQWHLHHDGGRDLAPGSHIDAKRAWDLSRGKRSIVVAVADDGIDYRHPNLQGNGKIVHPRDFRGGDFEPLPGYPAEKHGTACAGVAVAEEARFGVVGAAPGCALMPIRTTGTVDGRSFKELCFWAADHGAAVLSCSWGSAGRRFPLGLLHKEGLLRLARQGRGGLGCVVVFGVGNDNRPVRGRYTETSSSRSAVAGETIFWHDGFALSEHVIAVSASTSLGTKAAYSDWGREITLCAPSSNEPPDFGPEIPKPRGLLVVTTDRPAQAGYTQGDYTNTFGGCSSAAALVSGVAALVLSEHDRLTAAEVRTILQATADRIVDPAPDPQMGERKGTYDQSGHSEWFGYGKVNAFRAVTEARRRRLAGT